MKRMSASLTRNGSTLSERRNGIPLSTYSDAIEPTCPTVISTATSFSTTFRHSPAISDVLQVGPDEPVQPGGLLRLLAEFLGQALHLLLERLAVVLGRRRADVAARRQD